MSASADAYSSAQTERMIPPDCVATLRMRTGGTAVILSTWPMGGGAVQPGPMPNQFWYSGSVSPTSA
jgi:hypothetical protein